MSIANKQSAVVIDIDNTIIDTSVRKQYLLQKHYNICAELSTIKSDYHLRSFLGQENTASENILRLLDSPDAIEDGNAPSFSGAKETINWLSENGLILIYLTARPESCRSATLREFERQGIPCNPEYLFMRGDEHSGVFSSSIASVFKAKTYLHLSSKYNLIAGIGDRPEDVLAAQNVSVPAILFTTTVSNDELIAIKGSQTTGIEIANSWPEIAASFQQIHSGIAQMEQLRTLFIGQYSKWLYDIDEKLKSVIAISSLVSAIAGNQLIQISALSFANTLLVLALFLSVLSILYCIRGLTSRRTSGHYATSELKGHAKQFISILFGGPSEWIHRPNDAIDKYKKLRNKSPEEKAAAHLSFFHEEYGTYNPQALLNMRMLELRSAVYIKSYAERVASQLLMVAIISILGWITVFTFVRLGL